MKKFKALKNWGQIMGWIFAIIFTIFWWIVSLVCLKGMGEIQTREDCIICTWFLISFAVTTFSTYYLFKKIEDIK